MKINDYFPDSERFFKYDCYCPNEVYDVSGFSYRLYYPDDQFSYVMKIDDMYEDTDTFVGISRNEFLVVFVLRENNEFNKPVGTIEGMQRISVNKSNYLALRDILRKVPEEDRHNFEPDKDSMKSLNKILSISDAIICD